MDMLVTGIIVTFTLIYVQLQMVGGLFLIQVASGGVISSEVSGLIFFAILVIYLWAGGLRAVALADTFYGLLIIVTIVSSGIFLMKTAGGMEHMFQQVVEKNVNNVTLQGPNGGQRTGLWLSLFIVVPVGAFMGPQMWIRNYAARASKNFDLLPFLLCLSSIICIGTLFSGSAGILLDHSNVSGDTLIARLMLSYANPLFCAFVFLGIAAAIFSTANSQIHALSAIYTMDIHRRYINPRATERGLLSIAKWSVLIISIAAYILLLATHKSIFDMGIFALGGMTQLFIGTAGALFWKRSTAKGVIWGLICGLFVFLLCNGTRTLDTSYCAVIGLACNCLVFILVSSCTAKNGSTAFKIETYREEYRKRAD